MFSYGNKFKITIYGASHEETMGLIIDNIKPGIKIDYNLINNDLKARRPNNIGTTTRIEEDEYIIKNGLFNNYTTGAPLHIEVLNKNIKSKDYSHLQYHFRPNHADFVANKKYHGFNDYRGGGFFSGRMTSLLVIAGSIAKMMLPFEFSSKITQIGTCKDEKHFDNYLKEIIKQNDSVGGVVEVKATNLIVGLGDPYFNKVDAKIAEMMLTIPGVRGIMFGKNFNYESLGSQNNDLIINEKGKTKTNYSGGIVGGITNGNDIVFNVYVKPTSSIQQEQLTYHFKNNKIEPLLIKGRHDVAFVRRIPVVLENALAIVLANFYL